MIVSIATGLGLQKRITEKVTSFTGHFQILPYPPDDNLENVLEDADSLLTFLRHQPGILHVQKISEKRALLKTENDFEGVVLKGIDSTFDWNSFDAFIRAGKRPNFNTADFNDSLVVSETLMQKLNLNLGDEVALFFVRDQGRPPLVRRLTVGGTFTTGMEIFDSQYIIGHHKHLQQIMKWPTNAAQRLEVFVRKPKDAEKLADYFTARLPMSADTWLAQNRFPEIFKWIELFDINIYLILIIMLAVGLVNTIVALLTLILESKRHIGLFKAIGASNAQLRSLYRYRSLYIMGYGLLWGNVLGLGFCILQSTTGFLKLDPEVYFVDKVPIAIEIWHIVALNALVVVSGYLSMNLPVRIISRIDPTESMKAF